MNRAFVLLRSARCGGSKKLYIYIHIYKLNTFHSAKRSILLYKKINK